MRVSKQNATGGKAVIIWSLRLWMAPEAADPVVEIVHRDEKDIWSSSSIERGTGEAHAQSS